MFNLRATAKLLRRLKCEVADAGEATTRLGDWYGTLFSVSRQQFAMYTSERSLLTVVMPSKEIQPLPATLAASLRRLLADLKVPTEMIDEEVQQTQICVVTTTTNRSVLGSMNEFVISARLFLTESPPLPLAEIHRRLAETPMKPLDYRFPCEAALELLREPELDPRERENREYHQCP